MAFASRYTRDIYLLAWTYAAHIGRSVEAVSGFVMGKGGFFARLETGADCTTTTLDHVQIWFDLSWPIDLAWPAGVQRGYRKSNASGLLPEGDFGAAPAEDADFLTRLSHLPIWKNGRRPAWWHDLEIREFLTRAHRQMSILLCAQKGRERFGSRCPKKSAIHVYWQRLDEVLAENLQQHHAATPQIPRPATSKEAA